MTSSIVHGDFSEVVHSFSWHGCHFWDDVYTLRPVSVPKERKEAQDVKSGDLGCRAMSHLQETRRPGSNCLNIAIDRLAV